MPLSLVLYGNTRTSYSSQLLNNYACKFKAESKGVDADSNKRQLTLWS